LTTDSLQQSLAAQVCAYESKTPTPGAALAAQTFNALMARAGTRWDSAAILQVIEDMNGRTA